jgi:hypothetical protein
MIPGFNHNVKYKDQEFHIQTEDSGVQNPHILTHLYRGGDILASERQDYSEFLSESNLTEVVRKLMQEQHKGVLRGLVRGAYDSKIFGANLQDALIQEDAHQPIAEITRPQSMEAAGEVSPHPVATVAPPKMEEIVLDAAAMREMGVANRMASSNTNASGDELPNEDQTSASSGMATKADPDPVLDGKISPPKGWPGAEPSSQSGFVEQAGDGSVTDSEKRKETQNKAVIFGEDLISEKSLDEVILHFLREDFES